MYVTNIFFRHLRQYQLLSLYSVLLSFYNPRYNPLYIGSSDNLHKNFRRRLSGV
jgi:hypothetical protein